jgi:putative addiction module antidote
MQAHALKLTSIGNSVGVILPKEVLAAHDLAKGDEVFLTDSPNGLLLNKYDTEFAQQMAIGRKIMKQRRNVLRELAK